MVCGRGRGFGADRFVVLPLLKLLLLCCVVVLAWMGKLRHMRVQIDELSPIAYSLFRPDPRTLYPYTVLVTFTGPQRRGSSRDGGGCCSLPLVAASDDRGGGGGGGFFCSLLVVVAASEDDGGRGRATAAPVAASGDGVGGGGGTRREPKMCVPRMCTRVWSCGCFRRFS